MTFLPDVNVWIAIAVADHEHHQEAANWLATTANDSLAFCRITQMGFLRLLTNARVMGPDRFSPQSAWQLFDRLCRETGAAVSDEPGDFETAWRQDTAARVAGPNAWTDAYIAAFAQTRGFRVVTFDQAMARHGKATVRVLRSTS